MSTILMSSTSESNIKLSYIALSTIFITLSSINYLNTLELAEKLLFISILSSAIASILVLINPHQYVVKLVIWVGKSNDHDYQTSRTAPFIRAYSSFFSQIILIFTFTLALILTLIFMDDSGTVPNGILGNIFAEMPLKWLVILFFILSSLFLLTGVISLYNAYINRIRRATIFYKLNDRKSLTFSQDWYIPLNEYENTLYLRFWKVEKKKYNILIQHYSTEIGRKISNLLSQMNNMGPIGKRNILLKKFIDFFEPLGVDIILTDSNILELLKDFRKGNINLEIFVKSIVNQINGLKENELFVKLKANFESHLSTLQNSYKFD